MRFCPIHATGFCFLSVYKDTNVSTLQIETLTKMLLLFKYVMMMFLILDDDSYLCCTHTWCPAACFVRNFQLTETVSIDWTEVVRPNLLARWCFGAQEVELLIY